MTTEKPLATQAIDPVLAEHARVIRGLGSRIVSDVIEIGRRLSDAKARVGHGGWLPWLEQNFGWTDHTALNFMRVYELSSNSETVSDLSLPVSALYLLAAPSTPDEARTEVIARAEAGEKMPVAAVKAVIERARTSPSARRSTSSSSARKPATPPASTSAPTPPAASIGSSSEPLTTTILREWKEAAPCLEGFTRHSPGQIAAAVSNAADARTRHAVVEAANVFGRVAVELGAPPAADIGATSSGENARKLARLEELESENRRLERENLALTSEIADLKDTKPKIAEHGDATLYCSFCGKSQHEVRTLIAGPAVWICDECSELCADVVRKARDAAKAEAPAPVQSESPTAAIAEGAPAEETDAAESDPAEVTTAGLPPRHPFQGLPRGAELAEIYRGKVAKDLAKVLTRSYGGEVLDWIWELLALRWITPEARAGELGFGAGVEAAVLSKSKAREVIKNFTLPALRAYREPVDVSRFANVLEGYRRAVMDKPAAATMPDEAATAMN